MKKTNYSNVRAAVENYDIIQKAPSNRQNTVNKKIEQIQRPVDQEEEKMNEVYIEREQD